MSQVIEVFLVKFLSGPCETSYDQSKKKMGSNIIQLQLVGTCQTYYKLRLQLGK